MHLYDNHDLGKAGEVAVVDELRRKYPASKGYEVTWLNADADQCLDQYARA